MATCTISGNRFELFEDGSGEPLPDRADNEMLEHVDDLAAVLRACDAAPAHLVGHSYGGSHLMHEDNPPAFNEAVLSFLAGQAHGASA